MESPISSLEVLHRAATIMAQENSNGKFNLIKKLSLFIYNFNKTMKRK